MQAIIASVPRTPEEWNWWGWSHRQSHHLIREAIQQAGGPNLPSYVLSPITESDFTGFLEANALAHFDMNGVLGVQGSDLTGVNPKDENSLTAWVYDHWLEHQTAETKLGVVS